MTLKTNPLRESKRRLWPDHVKGMKRHMSQNQLITHSGPTCVANRYVLRSPLGEGQLSKVFLAEDLTAGRAYVALKLLHSQHSDALRKEFFRRETNALERLDHPSIVRIMDNGWDDHLQIFYIVLEHLDRTLIDELARHPDSTDNTWCIPLMRKLAEALMYAHSEGVIHRDIKPSNILLDASGEPKLADFGISHLKNELSVGMTVGSFWTAGYAAPEQQQGYRGDEKSDIYSLGAVFYHLLSRSAPPSGGPAPEQISTLPAPQTVRSLLTRMLQQNPALRPDNTQVLRVLVTVDDQTSQAVPVWIQVTERARQRLYDYGFVADGSVQSVREWLIEELGGDQLRPIQATLRQASAAGQNNRVELLGNSSRIILTRHRSAPVLVILDLLGVYDADLEDRRSRAASIRRFWEPVTQDDVLRMEPADRISLERGIDELFDELASFSLERRVQQERYRERRDLVEEWERVLAYQEEQVLREADPLAYVAFEEQNDTLRFALREPAPDSLEWIEGTPLAVLSPRRGKQLISVGTLIAIQGDEVWVNCHVASSSRHGGRMDLPPSGRITVYDPEARSLIQRQRRAVRAVREEDTHNPRLPDILVDLKRARFDAALPELEPTTSELSPDKVEAIQRALAAQDLFLIQGPPGTGKTTAITELVAQILARKPMTRILIASQSNIAVNHVLYRLTRVIPHAEIVRVGREERVGHGAEDLLLSQRLEAWRTRVAERCEQVVAELDTDRNGTTAAVDDETVQAINDYMACLEWIAEAEAWLEDIAASEELLEAVVSTSRKSRESLLADPQVVNLESEIRIGRQQIVHHLASVRSLLSDEISENPKDDDRLEAERLRLIVSERIERMSVGDTRWEVRTLIRDWLEVVGRSPEFTALLLDRASVIGATCTNIGTRDLRDRRFDWVIVDEAGKATAPEILIPLVRGRRAVLVGDERQLPPMIDDSISPDWAGQQGIKFEELQESLFETLVKHAKHERPEAIRILSVQQRMHPAIGQLVSDVFYGGELRHGVTDENRRHELGWIPVPVMWLSTSAEPGRLEQKHGSSFENPLEASGVLVLLERMEQSYREAGQCREVGVISGYSAQIQALRARIRPADRERWQALDIEVATVDAFQGRDRDIIVYTPVRSNVERRLGFMKDRRRLNVALSRARQLLVIIGDATMLEQASSDAQQNPFYQVIQHIKNHPDECEIQDVAEALGVSHVQ